MAGVELATAYVSIVASAKGIGKSLENELKPLEDAASGTEGKVGGILDGVRGKVQLSATAMGLAVGAFAIKAASDFQNTALEAGKFGDAVGIGVEDASRLLEVSRDLGIGAGTVQGSFQRFNKAVADGKGALREYGVEIVRAKDGTIDANETYINAITTIGKIPDASKRAQAAQELFGRSYGEMSELMTMSATELHAALDGVGDAQVIDPSELQKARDFRGSMENVKDALGSITMAVGELVVSLGPAIDFLAKGVTYAGDFVGVGLGDSIQHDASNWDKFKDALVPIDDIWEAFNPKVEATIHLSQAAAEAVAAGAPAHEATAAAIVNHDSSIRLLNADYDNLGRATAAQITSASAHFAAIAEVDAGYDGLAGAVQTAERAVSSFSTVYAIFTGKLSQEEAWLGLNREIDQFTWKMNAGTLSTDEQKQAVVDHKQELGKFVEQLKGVPEETKTKLLSEIDRGEFDKFKTDLDALERQSHAIVVTGRVTSNLIGTTERRAAGGPVWAGQPYVVGEKRPELFVPDVDGTILPDAAGAMGGPLVGQMIVNTRDGDIGAINRALILARMS